MELKILTVSFWSLLIFIVLSTSEAEVKSCDIDKSNTNQSDCGEGGVCVKEGNGTAQCRCKTGYIEKNGNCTDINECEENITICGEQSFCINTNGSFYCISCGTGYNMIVVDSTHRKCEDIDECALGTHDCLNEASCYNTNGSYYCDEFESYDESRVSVDRRGHKVTLQFESDYLSSVFTEYANGTYCEGGSPFLKNVTENGTVQRECEVGYKFENGKCIDIDECLEKPDICHNNEDEKICLNLCGNYTCVHPSPCGSGYLPKITYNTEPPFYNRTCIDIDECSLEEKVCPKGYHCRNTLGSFRCDKSLNTSK